MYEEFQWHFTFTNHGKGAIDGLGGTLKLRIREGTQIENIDPYTAEEFVSCAKNISPNITTILYIPHEAIILKKQSEKIGMPNEEEIKTIPETKKMHFFEKDTPYLIKISLGSTDTKNYKIFNFISGDSKTEDLFSVKTK